MAQQTAVEWLVMTYHQRQGYIRQEDIEKANQIFKEQIKDAYWNGTMDISKEEALSEAEKFYNEYYNKNQ